MAVNRRKLFGWLAAAPIIAVGAKEAVTAESTAPVGGSYGSVKELMSAQAEINACRSRMIEILNRSNNVRFIG